MSDALLIALREHVGQDNLLWGASIDERYKTDWSRAVSNEPLVVVRPKSTEQVSATLRLCHAHRHPVTVQGGMTGLVGGSQTNPGDVVISMEFLQGVQEIDTAASTLTVWAGTPLQRVQEAAQAQGLYFAVDLGARGSCQIGGNISTNAGGNRVIRYGMLREQVLGLEVVLADGTVLTNLNKMLKDNAGYDLKQLFIGSEGTLGVVTRAVLRLHPLPTETLTALCAVPDDEAVLGVLSRVRQQAGPSLLAFEVMWPDFYAFMTHRVAGIRSPLAELDRDSLVILMEFAADQSGLDSARLEHMLEQAAHAGLLTDAAIAQSGAQAESFWRIRDSVSEFPILLSPYTSFDVSLPIQTIGSFVKQLKPELVEQFPNVESLFFGHIGDSNLHIVVHVPGDRASFPKNKIDEVVYTLVKQFEGSVSAEHGIGTRKKPWLGYSRSPEEIALMKTIKAALDPHQILNRGKVI
jgi:FAD/FMN-containing dehydrogenase